MMVVQLPGVAVLLHCLSCACRAFSPLEGFMSEQQYLSVVQNMRLPVCLVCAYALPARKSVHVAVLHCNSIALHGCG